MDTESTSSGECNGDCLPEYLILNYQLWKDKSFVQEEWIESSTANHFIIFNTHVNVLETIISLSNRKIKM